MNAASIDRGRNTLGSALLLVVLVALSSGGVAAAAATSECEIRAVRSQEVLAGASLENWDPVNERTVLIWTGRDTRANLIRLDRPLYGLAAASVIDLIDGDHDRTISPCGQDGIMIGDGQGDGTFARIVSIEHLSYRRTMELDRKSQAEPPALFAGPDISGLRLNRIAALT